MLASMTLAYIRCLFDRTPYHRPFVLVWLILKHEINLNSCGVTRACIRLLAALSVIYTALKDFDKL